MEIGSAEIAAFTGIVTALATLYTAITEDARNRMEYKAVVHRLHDGIFQITLIFYGFSYADRLFVRNGMIKKCEESAGDWDSSIFLGIQMGPNEQVCQQFLIKPFGELRDMKIYLKCSGRIFAQRIVTGEPKSDMVSPSGSEAEKLSAKASEVFRDF